MSTKRQRALDRLIRARRAFREELNRTPKNVRRAYSDSQPRGEDGRWIASGRIDEAAKAGSAKAAELFKEVSGEETGKLETWLQDAGMSKSEVQSAKSQAAGGGASGQGQPSAMSQAEFDKRAARHGFSPRSYVGHSVTAETPYGDPEAYGGVTLADNEPITDTGGRPGPTHPDMIMSMKPAWNPVFGRASDSASDEALEYLFEGNDPEAVGVGMHIGQDDFKRGTYFVQDRAKWEAFKQSGIVPGESMSVSAKQAAVSQVRHDEVSDLRNSEQPVRFGHRDFNEHGYTIEDLRQGDAIASSQAYMVLGSNVLRPENLAANGLGERQGPGGDEIFVADEDKYTRWTDGKGTVDRPIDWAKRDQERKNAARAEAEGSGPEGGLPKDEFAKSVSAVKADMLKYGEEIGEQSRDQFIDGNANMGWDDYATKHGTQQRQVLGAIYDKLAADAQGTPVAEGLTYPTKPADGRSPLNLARTQVLQGKDLAIEMAPGQGTQVGEGGLGMSMETFEEIINNVGDPEGLAAMGLREAAHPNNDQGQRIEIADPAKWQAIVGGGSATAAGRTPADSSRRHDEVADLRNSEKPVHFTTEDFTQHGYSPADALPGDTVSGEDWQEQLAKHPSVVGYFSPSLGWAKDLPNGDGVPEGVKARIFGVGDEDEDVEPVPPEQFGLTVLGDGAGRDMFAVADPDLWERSKAKFGKRGEEKGVQDPPPSSSAAVNAARSRTMEVDPQKIAEVDKLHPDLISLTQNFRDTKGRSRGKVRDETYEKSELIFNGKPGEMAAIGITKVVAPGDKQFPDKAIYVTDRAKYDAYMQKEAASQAFGSPVDGTVLPSAIINNARKNGRIVNLADAGIGQTTGPDGKSLYFVNDQNKYAVARKAQGRLKSAPDGLGLWTGGEDYEENAAHFERGEQTLVPMGRGGKYGPVAGSGPAKTFTPRRGEILSRGEVAVLNKTRAGLAASGIAQRKVGDKVVYFIADPARYAQALRGK